MCLRYLTPAAPQLPGGHGDIFKQILDAVEGEARRDAAGPPGLIRCHEVDMGAP